ncbi:MAG: LytR/AlgR family response regulator transcription factor [Eubacterium sp.]
MRVAICDDEKICIDDIVNHIDIFSNDSGIKFDKYIFLSADEMLKTDMNYDIAILDVEMDGTDGIKLGEHLRQVNPHIILMYVTAHRKYLDDALNLNAVRFFEKPIDAKRFYRGLRESIKRIDNTTINFYLKDGATVEKVVSQDIVYVEIEKRHSKVVTATKEYHSANHISFWKEKLNANIFVSPHKSFLINMNYVTSYERDTIIMNDKYIIPVSRNRQTEFYRAFLRFAEGK